MDLKKLSHDELVQLVKDKKVGMAELTDAGICPTCFDRANNNVLFGLKWETNIL